MIMPTFQEKRGRKIKFSPVRQEKKFSHLQKKELQDL